MGKKLEIQKKLRGLTEAEVLAGSGVVRNHAYNPSTDPTEEVLPYVNDQNVERYKRSKIEAYGNLLILLRDDVTKAFMDLFAKLFLAIVMPERPLWYVSEEDADEGDN